MNSHKKCAATSQFGVDGLAEIDKTTHTLIINPHMLVVNI